jgi:hypothetical protein
MAGQLPESCPLPPVKINVFDVECVDVARDIAEEGQANVDEEIGAAPCDHEDANGRDLGSRVLAG